MKKRRGNGEGALYKRSDGRWCGSVDLGWEDGKRRRKVVYGRTQADALAKMRTVQANVRSHLPVADERVTVEQHLTRWLEGLEGRASANTISNYEYVSRVHIVPTLGRKRLAALTPEDVQRLIDAKRASGLSVSTVTRVRAVLVQSLKQAEKWGIVARNVATLTDGPKQRNVEGRALTVDQARALLAAAAGDRLEALYVVLLSLGLRRGEALGLAWSDVDLDTGTLVVRRALKREAVDPLDRERRSSRLVLGDVKTARSRRSLNLPAPVVDALRSHRARQLQERLRMGDSWRGSELIFTTEVGTPIEPRNFVRSMSALCKRAGLGHWHPHELRHSAASILLAQGVPLEVVSEILGHASIRLTKDIYGHLIGPQKQHAAEAMGAALWGANDASGL